MPDGITMMSTMRTFHHPVDRLATRPHQAQRQNAIQRSIEPMARLMIPPSLQSPQLSRPSDISQIPLRHHIEGRVNR